MKEDKLEPSHQHSVNTYYDLGNVLALEYTGIKHSLLSIYILAGR